MMSALELTKADLRVVILDKGKLGNEASSAGGGIVSALYPWREPQACQTLYQWSQQYYSELCHEIFQNTGDQTDYIKSGLLILKPEGGDDFNNWFKRYESTVETIPQTGLARFANLNTIQQEALWLPDVAQVNNQKLMHALSKYLKKIGVTVMENTAVTQIRKRSNTISLLITEQDDVCADYYVLSAGAWSGNDNFNVGLNIKPVRGQMISYQLSAPVTNKIILSEGCYCIPKKNHELMVGSTVEDVGFNTETTAEAKRSLVRFAESLFPELSEQTPNKHWSGLRPKPDKETPLIGQHPKVSNLFVNTGHYRNGILAAPASARLLGDLLLARVPVLNPEPFSLNND